ncbi:MAG TPA: c-type cytochrome [Gemmatimonadaceae bacterium]|nr:c-type cytochrome [Gemmatimonadaceae bacterium]
MRIVTVLLFCVTSVASAQVQGKFPPDSLINTKVIPKTTPVQEVIGTMRNFTSALGVRCQFCHVGNEGQPLAQFNFASDEKRNKLVARQMMLMVQEINRRLDTIPQKGTPAVTATCMTCHRGVSRPVPLYSLIQEAAVGSNADSALRTYKALRARYYGRDAYDFSEAALSTAAFRTARAGKPDEALTLLRYNEELFPNSSGMSVFKGNIQLMKGDTAAAEAAFREAIKRDSTNNEAKQRLQAIGKKL